MKDIERLNNMASYFHRLLEQQPDRSEVYPTFSILSQENGVEAYIRNILEILGSDDIESDYNCISRTLNPDVFHSTALYFYNKYKIGHLRSIKTVFVKIDRYYRNILTITNKNYRLKLLHMIRSVIRSTIILAITDKNNILRGAYDKIYPKVLQTAYRIYHNDLIIDDKLENIWEMKMITGVIGLHKSSKNDFVTHDLNIVDKTDHLLLLTSSKEPIESTVYFRRLIQFKINSVKLSHVLLYAPMLTSLFDDYIMYEKLLVEE